ELPKDLRIEKIAPGKRVDVMLAAGEVRVMRSPRLPLRVKADGKRSAGRLPGCKKVELADYVKTGEYAAQSMTLSWEEAVAKHPGATTNLMMESTRSKNPAYGCMPNRRVVPLAWISTPREEEEEVLGPEPWAYGLGPANRNNLDAILRKTRQQGLISKPMTVD